MTKNNEKQEKRISEQKHFFNTKTSQKMNLIAFLSDDFRNVNKIFSKTAPEFCHSNPRFDGVHAYG